MARPRTFDEEAVVKAARDEFWRDGYEGTSMSDLCRATGLRSQSLYGAFGDKHQLFIRTLEDYCSSQTAGLAESRAAGESPWRWALSAVAFEDGGRLDLKPVGCFLALSTSALSQRDPEVHKAARDTYEFILDLFTSALEEARDLGEIRADVNADDAALAMLTAMQGIEFLSKSGIDDEAIERAKCSTVAMLTAAYGAARG